MRGERSSGSSRGEAWRLVAQEIRRKSGTESNPASKLVRTTSAIVEMVAVLDCICWGAVRYADRGAQRIPRQGRGDRPARRGSACLGPRFFDDAAPLVLRKRG